MGLISSILSYEAEKAKEKGRNERFRESQDHVYAKESGLSLDDIEPLLA